MTTATLDRPTRTAPRPRRPYLESAAEYEAFYRAQRAQRVVAVLTAVNANPALFDDREWTLAEQMTGLTKPLSPETRALVIGLMWTA